ncbi:hypothetical protein F66182_3141 [Fusarium sp. NRRL 66182]|nr:hypothetical protein F66182_3141 [Fusarium sp. NRRL 66182]
MQATEIGRASSDGALAGSRSAPKSRETTPTLPGFNPPSHKFPERFKGLTPSFAAKGFSRALRQHLVRPDASSKVETPTQKCRTVKLGKSTIIVDLVPHVDLQRVSLTSSAEAISHSELSEIAKKHGRRLRAVFTCRIRVDQASAGGTAKSRLCGRGIETELIAEDDTARGAPSSECECESRFVNWVSCVTLGKDGDSGIEGAIGNRNS